MPVEVSADDSPPAVVNLPQTGFYVAASDAMAPAVEHVYLLADKLDGAAVYQYRESASRNSQDLWTGVSRDSLITNL